MKTLEGTVRQVLEPRAFGNYAIPAEVLEAIDPGRGLTVIWPTSVSSTKRKLAAIPIVEAWVDVDPHPATIDLEEHDLEEGADVVVRLEEAVVEETRVRGDVVERDVHLWDVVDVDRGGLDE